MSEGTFGRRGLMRAGAAAAAGVAVGSVVGASPAAAATTDLRHGTVVFAPGEFSKQVAVPGGLNSNSHAWASVQSPLVSKVGYPTIVVVTKPNASTGIITIETQDSGPNGYRWWGVTIAWFVVG